jgi:hypothetical protein
MALNTMDLGPLPYSGSDEVDLRSMRRFCIEYLAGRLAKLEDFTLGHRRDALKEQEQAVPEQDVTGVSEGFYRWVSSWHEVPLTWTVALQERCRLDVDRVRARFVVRGRICLPGNAALRADAPRIDSGLAWQNGPRWRWTRPRTPWWSSSSPRNAPSAAPSRPT